jgi:hypothetical protein
LKTFTESVEEFKKAWTDKLGPEDAPMVTALEQAAAELDSNGVQAALLNTFGVTYRTLLKKAGDQGTDDDGFFDEV